ncbi:MAG: protein phosphatase protein [Flavipsychrobacter sp.]|nr:protein phosphatase protein [Flavipsychrobacter sp.]
MIWKAIGGSVIGTSHVAADKTCEDAIHYTTLTDANGNEALICCVSDGAGSAQYAAWASDYTTNTMVSGLQLVASSGQPVTEGDIYALVEDIYDGLVNEAAIRQTELNEYSCTLLGCYITTTMAAFFQVGDGAIVRNDGNNFYIPVWWPDNGEYQNTTSFIVDDKTFSNLNVLILEESVSEVAILSDGLQLLALNTESQTAHQPFFTDLLRFLRRADDTDKI